MRKIIVIPLTIVVTVIMLFLLWKFTSIGTLFSTGVKETISAHDVVLEKVEELGRLEAMKYQFRDVLEYTVKYNSAIWPDSKAVLIISGEAAGCIDLKKVKTEDIKEQGDTIYVHLPNPELCYHKVNIGDSKVYDTEYTYWNERKIIDQAMKEAEKHVKRVALKSDLLDRSKESAERTLKTIFEAMTQKKVIFTYPPQNKRLKREGK